MNADREMQGVHGNCACDPVAVMDWRKVAHRYVAWPNMAWRTCQLCGRGANARIHTVQVTP